MWHANFDENTYPPAYLTGHPDWTVVFLLRQWGVTWILKRDSLLVIFTILISSGIWPKEGCMRDCGNGGVLLKGSLPYIVAAALIEKLGNQQLEIVFLGTGAAMPSSYRNVTGIYLDFFNLGAMLMDCGEGTYGQLRRRYGQKADDAIRRLRMIWISHIHADHHAGLIRWCYDK